MKIINFREVLSDSLLWRCAKLYCEIWKESPWNEDFWRPGGVMQDIKQELKRSYAEGFVCLQGSAVLGFTWGYSVSCPEMNVISGDGKLDSLFLNGNQVFYVDELGVTPPFRKRGIGESLTKALLVAARKHSMKLVVLRTNKNANAARTLYRKIGFKNLWIEDENYTDRTYWIFAL